MMCTEVDIDLLKHTNHRIHACPLQLPSSWAHQYHAAYAPQRDASVALPCTYEKLALMCNQALQYQLTS